MTEEKRQPVFRSKIAAMIFFIILLFYTFAVVTNKPDTTEKTRIKGSVNDMSGRQAIMSFISDRKIERSLCLSLKVCLRFAKARQDCATAGDFNNCIDVKLGDEDSRKTGICRNNGQLAHGLNEELPIGILCSLYTLGN